MSLIGTVLSLITSGGDGDGGSQVRQEKTVAEKIRDMNTDIGTSMSFITKGQKYRPRTPNLSEAISPDQTGLVGFDRYRRYASAELQSKANVKDTILKMKTTSDVADPSAAERELLQTKIPVSKISSQSTLI